MVEYKFQLYDKEPKSMTVEELRTEIRCQKCMRIPLQIGIWHYQKARYKHCQSLEREIEEDKEQRIVGWRKAQIKQIDEKIAFLDNLIVASMGYREYLTEILSEKHRGRERALQKRRARHKKPRYAFNKNIKTHQMLEATRRWNKHKIEMNQTDKHINPYGWDKEKLFAVANDRGYMTKDAITLAISTVLGVTWKSAEKLIENGRLSWGRVLLLGAYFEMTPREFCDVFLSGYFEEVAPNEFRANQDNVNDILNYLSFAEKKFVEVSKDFPVEDKYGIYASEKRTKDGIIEW